MESHSLIKEDRGPKHKLNEVKKNKDKIRRSTQKQTA